jgi:heparosan-N-sulfate-glucuronate 5-epimerase
MSLTSRLDYYRRIFQAYLMPGHSQLTFWYESPQVNPRARVDALGEYYMLFSAKAEYQGHYDSAGIPMLDYRGKIGLQYNPISIAQWGLGNYNMYCSGGASTCRHKFLAASNWLCEHLEQNHFGLWVWNHHFDWEYRSTLKAPWCSGLGQGQGISLLLRAHRDTRNSMYLDAAQRAFAAFLTSTVLSGVTFTDGRGDIWFEEYIVSPPTHILNGFIWAAWGVYDYLLATGEEPARMLFVKATQTLLRNLNRYDFGFWSLYEQSDTRLKMLASPFYHRLHIVQLRIMHRLTGQEKFARYADLWENYTRSGAKRTRALCYKGAFKLCYY